jgi:hypothetical protein
MVTIGPFPDLETAQTHLNATQPKDDDLYVASCVHDRAGRARPAMRPQPDGGHMTRAELNELLTDCYIRYDIQQNGDEVLMLETIAAWAHIEEPGLEESDRDWMREQLISLARVLQDAAHIIQES